MSSKNSEFWVPSIIWLVLMAFWKVLFYLILSQSVKVRTFLQYDFINWKTDLCKFWTFDL